MVLRRIDDGLTTSTGARRRACGKR